MRRRTQWKISHGRTGLLRNPSLQPVDHNKNHAYNDLECSSSSSNPFFSVSSFLTLRGHQPFSFTTKGRHGKSAVAAACDNKKAADGQHRRRTDRQIVDRSQWLENKTCSRMWDLMAIRRRALGEYHRPRWTIYMLIIIVNVDIRFFVLKHCAIQRRVSEWLSIILSLAVWRFSLACVSFSHVAKNLIIIYHVIYSFRRCPNWIGLKSGGKYARVTKVSVRPWH